MTTRIKGLMVALEQDIRDDDIGPILTAIRSIRNVAAVEVVAANSDDWMARQRVKSEVSEKLYGAIREALK